MNYSILCLEAEIAQLKESISRARKSKYARMNIDPPLALVSTTNDIKRNEELIHDIQSALNLLVGKNGK